MVEIISREPHASVVKQIIRKHCGATLQYVPNDIEKRVRKDYGGGSETYYFIKCPNCSTKIGVSMY